ncbi:unnamed protein product, partial [Leptidea sinapis]
MRKFMRTRASAAPAEPHESCALANGVSRANGVTRANGVNRVNGASRRDEPHSTLSRYWSGSSEEGASPQLWEDAEFPAGEVAGGRASSTHILWLRPHDLCPRPRFLGDAALEADLEPDREEPEPPEHFAA